MVEPIRDAASATTYRGFSAVDARHGSGQTARPTRQRRLGLAALALATAAIAGGLAWFVTGADIPRAPAAPPARPAAPTSLRADTAIAPSVPQTAPRVLPVERAPVPAPARLAMREAQAAPPAPAAGASVAPGRPAFHCDWRLRRSERMICGNARLIDLDRQLNHAYGQAIAAGAPRARLRRDQDTWVLRREAAARSPAMLENYYVRRIRELQSMAVPRKAHHRRRHRR